MTMKKYKAVPFDLVHNIWFLKKRIFFIFWKTIGIGPREKVEEAINKLTIQ